MLYKSYLLLVKYSKIFWMKGSEAFKVSDEMSLLGLMRAYASPI